MSILQTNCRRLIFFVPLENATNSATTEDLSMLPSGAYTVTVSLGTCLSSSTFSVVDNALPPNLSASGTSANCGLSDGAADLNVSGGVGPFTYLWSNAAMTEDISNLTPGNYLVTVTGTNSCTAISSATVLNNIIVLNVNVTITLGSCQFTGTFLVADNTATPVLAPNITASICGANNGGIDLSVSGPAGPYTYLWSNLAYQPRTWLAFFQATIPSPSPRPMAAPSWLT